MPNQIQYLTSNDAVDGIVEAVCSAKAGEAPFALVLGSGFSFGLVPTTRELVEECLPLWLHAKGDRASYAKLKQEPTRDRRKIAADFWEQFVVRNRPKGCVLTLHPQTHLPTNFAEAYQAVFSHQYDGAVNTPKLARQLQRDLMQLDKPRLNAAHFLLASILGVQHGGLRNPALFKAQAAFCRLILTTNFDPFLQIALQAVNQLYFMSDTPELGISSEIYDAAMDAVHLVYLHGSVHRRKQAATAEEIAELKRKNAQALKPVLERHGVIVLGYSGWDDVLVEALAACDDFDNRLYWCGREENPLTPGAFGDRVQQILTKSTSRYVKIETAGRFMSQLCSRLVYGLPRLIDNPIGQLRDLLTNIDLKELQDSSTEPVTTASSPAHPSSSTMASTAGSQSVPKSVEIDFHECKETTLAILHEAENYFITRRRQPAIEKLSTGTQGTSRGRGSTPSSASPADSPASVRLDPRQALLLAGFAFNATNYQEAIDVCDKILRDTKQLTIDEECRLLNLRGEARYFSNQANDAVADWSMVISKDQAPVKQVSRALFNRAVAYGDLQETERELADYERLINDLPDAPVEQVASALYNRGVIAGQQGYLEKSVADFSRVIDDLKGVSDVQLAGALYNRGVNFGKLGQRDQAWEDYTRVIDNLPLAPLEQIATARGNRGWLAYEKKDFEKFKQDSQAALQLQPQLGYIAFNLALAHLALGQDDEALKLYQQAIQQFPADIRVARNDIEQAVRDWLPQIRAQPILNLLSAASDDTQRSSPDA